MSVPRKAFVRDARLSVNNDVLLESSFELAWPMSARWPTLIPIRISFSLSDTYPSKLSQNDYHRYQCIMPLHKSMIRICNEQKSRPML